MQSCAHDLHEREGDGKRNILLGWPYEIKYQRARSYFRTQNLQDITFNCSAVTSPIKKKGLD